MADEVEIEGVQYISSKRASELSGYAQDYIGQLARGGYIDAKRIGGLWHVSLASLQEHERKAAIAKAQQPAPPRPVADAESLVSFDGKDYVSASRAAHLTGYHQDYVGQLARSGTIASRQVGNRWYVERDAILAHKAEKDRLLGAVQSASVGIGRALSPAAEKMTAAYDEATSYFTYTKEEVGLLPQARERSAYETDEYEVSPPDRDEEHVVPIRISREYAADREFQYGGRINPRRVINNKRRRAVTYGVLVVVALTMAVGLTLGIAKNKVNPLYAFMNLDLSYLRSTADLTATAASVADTIGNVLERLLVTELTYKRTP